MLEIERHQTILRILEQDKYITVQSLVNLFKVSDATIRRDLIKLRNKGMLKRIRGGAEIIESKNKWKQTATFTSIKTPSISETPFEYRKGLMVEKKRLIAKKAASLCNENEAIIIDGGSTTYQMVYFLEMKILKILTHSLSVAEYLITHSNNTVILSGGVIYPDFHYLFDPFESNVFKNYYVSKIFMSVKGIDERGATNSDMLVIKMDQALIERGKELIILADSSKFKQKGELVLCGFNKIHTIITDSDIPDEARDLIHSNNVNLIIADEA